MGIVAPITTIVRAAEQAGCIPVHTRKQFAPDTDALEIVVWLVARKVVSVEPSITVSGQERGSVVELIGGQRTYVVESAEAVVSLLARMSEANRGN